MPGLIIFIENGLLEKVAANFTTSSPVDVELIEAESGTKPDQALSLGAFESLMASGTYHDLLEPKENDPFHLAVPVCHTADKCKYAKLAHPDFEAATQKGRKEQTLEGAFLNGYLTAHAEFRQALTQCAPEMATLEIVRSYLNAAADRQEVNYRLMYENYNNAAKFDSAPSAEGDHV